MKEEKLLTTLLENYRNTSNEIYMEKIYKILLYYSHKIINKNYTEMIIKMKLNRKEIIHDIATSIIEYIMDKPDFKIRSSWGGYIKLIARRFIYPDWEIYKNSILIEDENSIDNYFYNYKSKNNILNNIEYNQNYNMIFDKKEHYTQNFKKLDNNYYKIKYAIVLLSKLRDKNYNIIFHKKGFVLKDYLVKNNLL